MASMWLYFEASIHQRLSKTHIHMVYMQLQTSKPKNDMKIFLTDFSPKMKLKQKIVSYLWQINGQVF